MGWAAIGEIGEEGNPFGEECDLTPSFSTPLADVAGDPASILKWESKFSKSLSSALVGGVAGLDIPDDEESLAILYGSSWSVSA